MAASKTKTHSVVSTINYSIGKQTFPCNSCDFFYNDGMNITIYSNEFENAIDMDGMQGWIDIEITDDILTEHKAKFLLSLLNQGKKIEFIN
jgi:hypothetical protein